jgi:hypothetical protein
MNVLGIRLENPRSSRKQTRRRPVWRAAVAVAAGAALGAGVMYIADPDRGRRRRVLARDRTAAIVRHEGRRIDRARRRSAATVYGWLQRVRYLRRRPEPADDQTLTDRILSQAFRDLDVPTGQINVNVEAGVAVLHGAFARADQINRVESAVGKVAGVRSVTSYLHLTDQPAPEERPRT